MARIGFFCLPMTGHLNPLAGLARELARHGHEVTFFNVAAFGESVRARGLRFAPYGEAEYPAGAFAARYRESSLLEGMEATKASLATIALQAEALFTFGPGVIAAAKLDLWVVDQMDYGASTLASYLSAPFVTAIVGLMRHYERGVPGFSGEQYGADPAALERDERFQELMLESSRQFRESIDRWRSRHGMAPFSYQTIWSPLAQITQQPAELEFPRSELPPHFHFTGPFGLVEDRTPTPFPWERLDGRRLIYASFGTAQNRVGHLYEAVVGAARGLDAQIVLSLGGADVDLKGDLPENLIVVPFAPQQEVLRRAALMITHAGMNSTLECLAAGVPMVAIPIAHDQPGVAARIEWTGTGIRIAAGACDSAWLRHAIGRVLGDPSYKSAAERFERLIAEGNGLSRAASIIEGVIKGRSSAAREL